MNLSDKAVPIDKNIMFFDTDIMKAIQELKEYFVKTCEYPDAYLETINQIFGNRLCEDDTLQ